MDGGRFPGIRERLAQVRQRATTDRRWLVAAAVVVAFLAGSGDLGITPGVVLAAGLIAAGVILLRPETAATTAGAGTTPSGDETRRLGRPVAARRPRSKLFALTLASVLVAMGTLFALDAVGVVRMDVGRAAAVPLLVVGVALIGGAWWGRSPALIVLGIALVPVVALANVGPVPFPGRIGDLYVMPREPFELDETYDVIAGSTTIDLSRFRPRGETVHIPIDFGVGEVDVLVPQRFAVSVTTRLRAGAVHVFGEAEQGRRLAIARTRFADLGDKGSVSLSIRGSAGSIAVTKVWTPPACSKGRPCERRVERRRGEKSDARDFRKARERPRRDRTRRQEEGRERNGSRRPRDRGDGR